MTVQVLIAPELKLVGLQASDVRARGGSSEMDAVCELLPNVAVTTAVCTLPIVPAVALKVLLVVPLATVTEVGTDRLALLSLKATVAFAAGASFSVTVHVLAAPEPKVVGLHCRDTNAKGGNSVSEAVCELLPNVAVITAVWEVATVAAVAENEALLAPLVTVAEAGSVRLELLPLMVTAVFAGTA